MSKDMVQEAQTLPSLAQTLPWAWIKKGCEYIENKGSDRVLGARHAAPVGELLCGTRLAAPQERVTLPPLLNF